MICLKTNKVCDEQNRKCKECKLNDCKEVIKMIETQEQRKERRKISLVKAQLPEKCRDCVFLEIIDLDKQKVRCSYIIRKCVLN